MATPVQTSLDDATDDALAAPTSANADTIINITHDPASGQITPAAPPNPAPRPPISQVINQTTVLPPQQAPAAPPSRRIGDVPRNYAQSQSSQQTQRIDTNSVRQTTTSKVVPGHKTINWGGVIKGAAIIATVVVVGVVGFWALSSLTTWALGVPWVNSLVASTTSLMTPLITSAGNGLAWLGGFAMHIPAAIGGFFSNMFVAMGAGSSAAVAGAAAAAPTFTAIAPVAHAAGIIGTGAAVAGGLAVAAPALDHLNLIGHTQPHVATTVTTDPASTASAMPHNESILSNLFASKTAAVNSSQLSDASMAHEAAHTSHTAAELGHHSLESHHGAEDLANYSPGMPTNSPNSLNGKRDSASWRDRMIGASNYQAALQSTGSHSAAVNASRPDTAVASRAADYTQALNDDRAKLDAALGLAAR